MSSTAILNFATQYSLVSGYIIFAFGIIGNVLNILVFTQLKLFRGNRWAFYLTVEPICSFIYQFVSVTSIILITIYGDDASARSLVWCRLRYILIQTAVLTGSYATCFAAIDQFFSTDYRFNLRQMCSLKLTRWFIFVCLGLCMTHSVIFGLFLSIQDRFGCIIANSVWLQYSTFFFYPVLIGLLPITIASSFSVLAFRNVRRIVRRQLPIARRRLDRQMTAMILIRVVIYVCIVTPYTINRIYVINFPISQNQRMEYAIGRMIQAVFVSVVTLNYTISCYVFILSLPRFRRQVKSVLIKMSRQCFFCFENNRIGPETPVELQENS